MALKLIGTMSGASPNYSTRPRLLKSGVTQAIYTGEPVVIDPANPGYIASLRTISTGANLQYTVPIIGVFLGCTYIPQDSSATDFANQGQAFWPNAQETQGGVDGQAIVCDDPWAIYMIQSSALLADFHTVIEAGMRLLFNTPASNSLGESTCTVNTTTFEAPNTTGNIGQFRLLRRAEQSPYNSTLAAPAGTYFEVMINTSRYHARGTSQTT